MTTRAEAIKQRKDIQDKCRKSLVSVVLGMCHTGIIAGDERVSVTMHRSQVHTKRYFNMDFIQDTDMCHRMFTKKVLQDVSEDITSAGYSTTLKKGSATDDLLIAVDLEKPGNPVVDMRGRVVALTYCGMFACLGAVLLASKPSSFP